MDPVISALLNGVGVVGLLGLLFYLLATGKLVTRREADGITARAVAAESTRDALIKQNGELMEWAGVGKSVFAALEERAKA